MLASGFPKLLIWKLYQSSHFVRLSQHYLLPKNVQIQFRNEMKPILCLMERSPLLRTSDRNLIDMDLKSSKKIKYLSIMQYGTENDKLRANRQKTHHNKKRRHPESS